MTVLIVGFTRDEGDYRPARDGYRLEATQDNVPLPVTTTEELSPIDWAKAVEAAANAPVAILGGVPGAIDVANQILRMSVDGQLPFWRPIGLGDTLIVDGALLARNREGWSRLS